MAFKIWSGDHFGNYPMQMSVTNGGTMEYISTGNIYRSFAVISNELNTPFILVCPADRARTPLKSFSTNFDDSRISYFVSLDASDTEPQMFLSGDRNITNASAFRHGVLALFTNQIIGWTEELHNNQGNVGLADGSVQQLRSAGLTEALKYSGRATNRIAIP